MSSQYSFSYQSVMCFWILPWSSVYTQSTISFEKVFAMGKTSGPFPFWIQSLLALTDQNLTSSSMGWLNLRFASLFLIWSMSSKNPISHFLSKGSTTSAHIFILLFAFLHTDLLYTTNIFFKNFNFSVRTYPACPCSEHSFHHPLLNLLDPCALCTLCQI